MRTSEDKSQARFIVQLRRDDEKLRERDRASLGREPGRERLT